MGVDAYNFKLTGDIACNLNATSCESPSHSGPSVLIQMDEVKSFSWANSPSMDMPFSENAQGLRACPNGYPAVIICYGISRAILKGGIYSFLLTLLLLAISVLFSFIDSLFK